VGTFEEWMGSEAGKLANRSLSYPEPYWHIVRDIWLDMEYEQHRKVTEGDIVVDAGATIGDFTVKAALQAGNEGFVYAFEPEPDNYSWLKRNTENLRNVKIFDKALWNKAEKMTLWRTASYRAAHTLGSTNSSLIPRTIYTDKIEVETVRLDEAITGRVDFIKLDVEGSELNVLEGAKRILEQYKPFIAAELHPYEDYPQYDLRFNEVNGFLYKYGYKTVKRKGVEAFPYGTIYFE